uniref:Hexosyltransferase n=1 Tax=Romanomermis culicivorax TaxID=13658 RepID=A0A915KBC3_ROMCU
MADHRGPQGQISQVDSDSVIYPLNLDAFVEKHLNVSRRIYGLCYLNADIHRRGKWKVPRRRLGSHHYPEYCIGAAYLMTGDVPSLLVDQINGRLGYLSIDDAYFSGILAEKARITRVDFKDGFKYKSDIDSSFFKKCPCRSLLASFEYKSPSLMKKAWNDYTKAE